MNPLFELKKTAPLLLITLTLHCTMLLPQAQAVVPPPDGGYPGFNTAEGHNALLNLTTGSANTAVGWFSLSLDATGSFNTATGAGTLLFNTGDQNTAFGAAALLLNTTSTQNTAVGTTALLNNTTGNANTATGAGALYSNTEGFSNTATGAGALHSNTEGHDNTAVGLFALLSSTGSGNTAIGTGAGASVTTAANVICIGDNGANVSDSCYIGKIYGTSIDPATTLAVGMDASHRLGTAVSSERFKRDIQPMGKASEAIMALKPVMFHYKSDSKNTPCFGLVAEHVAEVNPDLVIPDKEGKPYAVRYDQVNAMLLHEFQKEHRRNEEQEAAIAQQQEEIKALKAELKEHASQIQKVSAQIEASRAALQVVNNNP